MNEESNPPAPSSTTAALTNSSSNEFDTTNNIDIALVESSSVSATSPVQMKSVAAGGVLDDHGPAAAHNDGINCNHSSSSKNASEEEAPGEAVIEETVVVKLDVVSTTSDDNDAEKVTTPRDTFADNDSNHHVVESIDQPVEPSADAITGDGDTIHKHSISPNEQESQEEALTLFSSERSTVYPANEDEHHDDDNDIVMSKILPRWYPTFRGRPVFYGTPEALAWACTVVGQAGIFIGIGAFIGPALVTLAKEEAGCETEPVESGDASTVPECHGTVYGFKPSSLLTIMSSIVGISSAIIIPIVGAVVDYTAHRRLIGRWCSGMYSILILTLVFLNDDSWFALSIVLLVAVSIGWAQGMLFYAYLPELTDDESRLNEYSKTFTVLIFSTMVVYLAVVMGIAMAFGFAEDDVAVARCGAVVAFVLGAVLFYAAWGILFEERPASHILPEGQSLWGAGFRQVYRTTIKIYRDYRALKWFYVSICFGDAAIQSLSVIAITYITDQLQLSSQEVGAAALLMLLGSIPGALVGAFVNKRFNPIRSSGLSVLGMIIGTTLAAIFLKEPGQQMLTYFFAFLWGGGTGW